MAIGPSFAGQRDSPSCLKDFSSPQVAIRFVGPSKGIVLKHNYPGMWWWRLQCTDTTYVIMIGALHMSYKKQIHWLVGFCRRFSALYYTDREIQVAASHEIHLGDQCGSQAARNHGNSKLNWAAHKFTSAWLFPMAACLAISARTSELRAFRLVSRPSWLRCTFPLSYRFCWPFLARSVTSVRSAASRCCRRLWRHNGKMIWISLRHMVSLAMTWRTCECLCTLRFKRPIWAKQINFRTTMSALVKTILTLPYDVVGSERWRTKTHRLEGFPKPW